MLLRLKSYLLIIKTVSSSAVSTDAPVHVAIFLAIEVFLHVVLPSRKTFWHPVYLHKVRRFVANWAREIAFALITSSMLRIPLRGIAINTAMPIVKIELTCPRRGSDS